ncbi:MAG: glycosyltransferase [Anaerolineae bacterium]|nr:glycosyltransferase [Anaerolineae bacterium]
MRVALFVHRFLPTSTGGTELYAFHLARGLLTAGHSVEVYTWAPSKVAKVECKEDVFQEIPVCRLSFSLETANPLRDEYDHPLVAEYLRQRWAAQPPDVVHILHFGYLSTSPALVAKELEIPLFVTLTDMWVLCPNGLLLRADGQLCEGPSDVGECVRCYAAMGPRGARYAWLVSLLPKWGWRGLARLSRVSFGEGIRYLRWMNALVQRSQIVRSRLGYARTIFCPARFLCDLLQKNGYPQQNLVWAPHGISHPERLRRQSPVGEGPELRFGYIGPLEYYKGAHLLLEAFLLLSPVAKASLTFWGRPPQGDFDQRLLERISSETRTVFRGPFNPRDIRAVLEKVDVLVVPSLCYENTPTVIYEALASGTPVIASDQGGMRELIMEYKGGWLFPRGDIQALAELMESLIREPRRVSQAAEQIRPVPSLEEHLRLVEALYRQNVGSVEVS